MNNNFNITALRQLQRALWKFALSASAKAESVREIEICASLKGALPRALHLIIADSLASMSIDYLLHESSVGYAIFQVVHQPDIVGNRMKEFQDSVQVRK